MQEIWKDVVGYEDYFMVSNLGNIFSKRSRRNIKQTTSKSGYKIFSTRFGGRGSKAFCFKVHRLVAEAFLEPASDDIVRRAADEFYGKVIVRHIDNNKTNNCADNLAWGNSKDNTADYMKTEEYAEFRASQTGHLNTQSKLTEEDVKFLRENYQAYHKEFGARALAKRFNVHHTKISKAVRGLSYSNIQ